MQQQKGGVLMLPIDRLPIDVKGLTDEMRTELEERVREFESEYESVAASGGGGYVEKIQKKDFIVAGVINGVILIYWLIVTLSATI
jgi:hypothetical protein